MQMSRMRKQALQFAPWPTTMQLCVAYSPTSGLTTASSGGRQASLIYFLQCPVRGGPV